MCSNSLIEPFPMHQQPQQHYYNNMPYNDQSTINWFYQNSHQQLQYQYQYIPIQIQFLNKSLLNSDGTESENLYKIIDSIFNFFEHSHQDILKYQKLTNYMKYIQEPVISEDELFIALEATEYELVQNGSTRKEFHQYQPYSLKTNSPKWQKEMKTF